MKKRTMGNIDIWIDELDPCLRNTETGELAETAVFRVESRSYLKKFSKKNGWHINWSELPKNSDVYALVLKETNEVQGLVCLENDKDAHAAFIRWACTAPWNNMHDMGSQKYAGVGGHLFAIAADKSMQWGYEGAIHGFASNKEVLEHYINIFHAEHLAMLHEYQFFINETCAEKLMEVYTYEWYDS